MTWRGRIRTTWTLIHHLGVLAGVRIAAALVREERLVSFSNEGRRYWIDGDESAVYHLIHNIQPLRNLAAYVRPSDMTVVDVGAHSGLFSSFASELAPSAHFIVVEPDPSLAQAIGRNLRAANWRLVNEAVGASPGRATFYRNKSSTQTSSLLRDAVDPYGSDIEAFEVAVTTLDELLAGVSTIDVLKVDVQGAESMVIRGGAAILPRVRTLLIEVSLLGPHAGDLLRTLEAEFGEPTRVNIVAGGADLAFERAR